MLSLECFWVRGGEGAQVIVALLLLLCQSRSHFPYPWFFFSHLFFCQINGKDMKIARHEDAVGMLTGGLSYVTLVVVRERVINKRMLPLSKLQDQSILNKRLPTKVSWKSLHLQRLSHAFFFTNSFCIWRFRITRLLPPFWVRHKRVERLEWGGEGANWVKLVPGELAIGRNFFKT